MIIFVLVVVLIAAAMLAVRFAVHHYFPAWGTVWANMMAGFMVVANEFLSVMISLFPELQSLPWGDIFNAGTAKAVMFGILFANIIMRKLPR